MPLESRKYPRTARRFLVQILAVQDSRLSELAAVENVSSGGTRLVTERQWENGAHVILKFLSSGTVWGRARVVYCQAVRAKVFAVGLDFVIQTSLLQAIRVLPLQPFG